MTGRKKLQKNLGYLVLIFWGLLLCLAGRYAWLQLVLVDKMTAWVKAQSEEHQVLQSPRGLIVDRNGRELAVSIMTKSLFVDPNHVKNPDELSAKLAPIIGLSEQEIKDDIAVGGGFVWVKRRMEPEEVKKVQQLMHDENYGDCLGFRDEAKRYYPNAQLASNVLGFVGTDDVGLDGIEQACDKLIKGEREEKSVLTDTYSRPILESLFSPNRYQANQCKTIELTLDSSIQFIVEQALDKAMQDNSPQSVTAIVMNPKTGEILAMASRPSYDPNHFADYAPDVWRNRAVSSIYEPGSTFKAVVAGAALQEKIVTPNQVFVDPGHVMVSGHRIQNWNGESFGTVTFTDVVKNSLNTGFAQVGLQLGADKLVSYAKLFGFGEATGVGLPAEASGIIFEPKDMVDSDMATMAIGQSIAVTPLQLVTAMSAIANDGKLLKPHIIKSIKNADGSIYEEKQVEEVRQTIDVATDKTLIGLLEQVVATGGGKKAAVKGYRIAGKTGTAQKVKEDGAGYLDGHYIASFCGFAPVEDPQITVLVVIDDPSGMYYGGTIAAPVAHDIFEKVFRYLHIEPSSDPFAGMDQAQEKKKQEQVAAQPVKPAPAGKVLVPDLRGKSLREAAALLSDRQLRFNAQGSGIAASQDPVANTIVEPGTSVTVYFELE